MYGNMKIACIVIIALLGIYGKVQGQATECDETSCNIKQNCRCSSSTGPLSVNETPQLIVLAFVDSAREETYNDFWSPLVEPRTNPDGEFVGATFYVPHEYSNYQIVHDLAANGFEIAVHSVTNDPHQAYWRDANQELLEMEFGDARKIISKFANIPEEYITGALTPQLQLAGDNSIRAFASTGFVYDNSWASRKRLYPYTLDHISTQSCDTGTSCPKESHPGFWIAPIVDLTGEDGDVCATIAACFRSRYNQTVDEIADWLIDEVKKVKDSNRAPLTFIIEENWFKSVDNAYDGLVKALDEIQKDKEVFLVSQRRVIEWIKNPLPIGKFGTNPTSLTTGCVKNTCNLKKDNGDVRYMVSCVPCPPNYPWLGNPEGN